MIFPEPLIAPLRLIAHSSPGGIFCSIHKIFFELMMDLHRGRREFQKVQNSSSIISIIRMDSVRLIITVWPDDGRKIIITCPLNRFHDQDWTYQGRKDSI